MNDRKISTLLAALLASAALSIGSVSAQSSGSASGTGASAPGTGTGASSAPGAGSAGSASANTSDSGDKSSRFDSQRSSSATAPATSGPSTGSMSSSATPSARGDTSSTARTDTPSASPRSDTARSDTRTARTDNTAWQRTHRVSKIIGTDVRNDRNEKIGDVKDVVIDDNGKISYVVVSAGGFLGIGDKLVAVPYNAFRRDASRDHFVLNVDKERLRQAHSFDDHNWPNMADSRWISENSRPYASASGSRTGTAASSRSQDDRSSATAQSNRSGASASSTTRSDKSADSTAAAGSGTTRTQ